MILTILTSTMFIVVILAISITSMIPRCRMHGLREAWL